ncbi:hypothetical protein T07_8675 [Trichinella nelsoni]|uniref:Uncharacterized protein n=1 Tax=Trichinella nelsoni TaxID=6336 RepID=A0A0V0RBP4_9BILA|nr:hypothetical protein T07_8675 [Trichinella nelsoni]
MPIGCVQSVKTETKGLSATAIQMYNTEQQIS